MQIPESNRDTTPEAELTLIQLLRQKPPILLILSNVVQGVE